VGQEQYWTTFWDADQVFYGHVLGFEGLERSAVVLALNEREPAERSRERLYVASPGPATSSWCAVTRTS
jgi:hypothetical protein